MALLGAGFSLFAASAAFAQTTAPAGTTDETVKLEKFVVTGSYLPAAANSVAIPVISVDSKAIENSGSNNVLEILRKTVPQFNGNGNLGSGNANVGSGSTNGGSKVALRNTDTLVLINGRRVAYAPVGASGGFQFVDVNLIPTAAIERIEVLADGASAIYGTDAVAGVVNIILKTDFQGFELGAHYGWTDNDGHAQERGAHIVGGVSNGTTSMTLSAEWFQEDPVYAYQRPYSAVTFGTPTFAGSVNTPDGKFYYLDPSKSAPTVTPGGQSIAALIAAGVYSGPRTQGEQFELFNLSQYVTQKTQNERQSMTLAAEHKINDSISLFADFLYSNTQTFSQINGQPLNLGGFDAGDPGNPFNVTVTPRNRLTTNPRQYINDTTGVRGVVGFKGSLTPDWNWEAAANYNRIKQEYRNPGVINNDNLFNAVVDGAFNMFSRANDPAVYGPYNIVGVATGGFLSRLSNYDAKVTGKAFDLPAGSVDIALGGEIRKEFLSGIADPLSIPDQFGNIGWNGATSLSPFEANRKVESIFAEVRVPLAKDAPGAHLLELSGAVRYEKYSDTTDPTVPKLTVRYLPFDDQFAIRGSYSKSFSAPTLYQLFGPAGIGFTNPFTLTPAGGGADIDNFQTNFQSTANPGLAPAKARNWTAGVVYSPKAIKGFSVSVDYWNIKQNGLIGSYGADTILQDVELLGSASQYANRVKFGGFNGTAVGAAPGQISNGVPDDIYVTDALVNLASLKLDGFDITAKYTWNTDTMGRFDFTSNTGIYRSYDFVFFPGDPAFETVGKSTVTNGTIPRWQTYTSVDYTLRSWNAFAGVRYLPGVSSDDPDTSIGSFYTLDAAVSYTFGSSMKYLSGAKFTLGVTNAFNRFGPLDPTVNTDANVDISTYGSMGRFFYADMKIKF